MGLFFEPGSEPAHPLRRRVEIIHAKEQEKAVAGGGALGTRQRGMLVGAPLVQAEQDRSIRVEDLTKVLVSGGRLRLAEQRLVPPEAARHILHPDDRPGASHRPKGRGMAGRPGGWRPRGSGEAYGRVA